MFFKKSIIFQINYLFYSKLHIQSALHKYLIPTILMLLKSVEFWIVCIKIILIYIETTHEIF